MQQTKMNQNLLGMEFDFHSPCSVQECAFRLQAQVGRAAIQTSPRQWGLLKVMVEPVDGYSARFELQAASLAVRGTLAPSGSSTHVVGSGHFTRNYYLFGLLMEIIGFGALSVLLLTADQVSPLLIIWGCFWLVMPWLVGRRFQKQLAEIMMDVLR